jgi:hypothetical protein
MKEDQIKDSDHERNSNGNFNQMTHNFQQGVSEYSEYAEH